MQKIKYSIVINAPREKVWKIMLEDETYREWTEPFMIGSHYAGNWEEGAEIKFLAPNDRGLMDGMISRIKEIKPYEFISIEHLGIVKNSVEDLSSVEVKSWQGALENYRFLEHEGGTELIVELDINEDWKKMLENSWPKALEKLKEIVEEECSFLT